MRNLRTKIRMIIGGGAAVGLVLYVLLGAVFKADVIDGESQVVESSLTNNGDQYSGSTIKDPVIPKYEKFELTFDINWYEGRAFTDPTQQYNPLAPEWTDADSKTGDFVLYKEKIYKCKADLPKSWRVKDKYNLDDIVRYNGKTYKDIKAGEHEAYTAVYADYTQQQNASDDNYGHYYSYPYPRPDDNEPGTTNGASYWEEIANFDAMPGVGADWNNYWLATDIKPLNSFWPYDEFPDANGVQWDNNTYYSENVRVKNGGKFYEVKAGQSVAPGDPEPGGLFSNWQEKWTDQIDAGWEPVPSKTGISVDGIFTNDKGESYTQPGFYYLDYDRERVNHWSTPIQWLYPKNKPVWKIRFAPTKEGNWHYSIRIRDISGQTTYSSGSTVFNAIAPTAVNPGFLRKSETDPRYFETTEGKYVNLMAINKRDYADTYDMAEKYAVFGQNKMNLIRVWWQSSQGPVLFGLHGQGGYTDQWSGMRLSTVSPPGKLFSSIMDAGDPGGSKLIGIQPRLIPYHKYRFSALVKTDDVIGNAKRNLRKIFAFNANTVWAVGEGGTILKTTNGTDWSPQTSGTTNNLNGVFAIDANTVWAVGEGGTILKTTNGTDWSPQTSGTTNNLNGVFAIDANTVWAVGSSGDIRYTTDGGDNWTFQSSGITQSLTSVFAFNTNTVWAVGEGGTILKTTNGTDWSPYYGVSIYGMHDVGGKHLFESKKLTGTNDWTLISTDLYNQYFMYHRLENDNEDEYRLSDLRVAMTNVDSGKAYATDISLKEISADGSLGPELAWRPSFDIEQNVSQLTAYEADKMVELAQQNNIYLKVVLEEQIDTAHSMIHANGKSGSHSRTNFYGGWGHHASRVYQKYYWRYIIARFGYATSIHSFEYVNEGDPFNGNFLHAVRDFNTYMKDNNPNRHMAISSTYHQLHNQEQYEYADWHQPAGFVNDSNFDHYIPGWRSNAGGWTTCKNLINYNYNDYTNEYRGPPGNLYIISDERAMGYPQFRNYPGDFCGVVSEDIAILPNHKYKVSWKAKASGIRNSQIKDAGYAYNKGSLYSDDGTNNWQNLEIPSGGTWRSMDINNIKTAPNGMLFALGGVYFQDYRGVYRSADNGANWERVGLKDKDNNLVKEVSWVRYFNSMAIAPTGAPNEGDIFVATDTSGLYRSTDNGDSWTQVKGPEDAGGVKNASKRLTNDHVVSVFVASDGAVFAGTDTHLFYSTDNGDIWTKVTQPEMERKYFTAFIETDSGHILASTRSGTYLSGSNLNDDWSKVSDAVVTGFAKNTSGVIFASTLGQSVIKSSDNGQTWASTKNDLNDISKGGDSLTTGDYLFSIAINSNNNNIYLGGPRGTFYQSSDNGTSWQLRNNNIEAFGVKSITVSADGKIWLGTTYATGGGGNGLVTTRLITDKQDMWPLSDQTADWTGTFDWKQAEYEFTAQDGDKTLKLLPMIANGIGEAWFDDITIFDLTDNKPVSFTNGSFDKERVDYDLTGFVDSLGTIIGKVKNRVLNKPLIIGESGIAEMLFAYDNSSLYNPYLKSDTDGIAYKKLYWGHIDPGGVIVEPEGNFNLVYNNTLKYIKAYQNFMAGIPLNNGHYEDTSATTSNEKLRAIGQKDLTNNKVHLWLDNLNYTWKAVVDHNGVNAWVNGTTYSIADVVNYSGKIYQSKGNWNKNHRPDLDKDNWLLYDNNWQAKDLPAPVSGTITVPGLADGAYNLEWWDTTSGVVMTPSGYPKIATSASGQLEVAIPSLTSDIALKVSPTSASNAINLHGAVSHRTNCPNVNGDITITPSSGGAPIVDKQTVSLNSSCDIIFNPESSITNGLYTITLDFPTLLKNNITNVSLPTQDAINLSNFTTGDLNHDDCIGMADWGVLFSKWDTTPADAGWDATYDLKGENIQIGMEDWGIMFAGWEQGAGCE